MLFVILMIWKVLKIDADNPKFYSRGKSVYNKATDELVFELGSYKGYLKQDGYIIYYDKNKNATLVRYNSDNKEKVFEIVRYFIVGVLTTVVSLAVLLWTC